MPADGKDADPPIEKDDKTLAPAITREVGMTGQPELDEWGLPLRKKVTKQEPEHDESTESGGTDTSSKDGSKPTEETPPGVDTPRDDIMPAIHQVKASKPADADDIKAHSEDKIPESPKSIKQKPRERSESKVSTTSNADYKAHRRTESKVSTTSTQGAHGVSEWSHQQLAPTEAVQEKEEEQEWQEMPAYAPFDIYNDDGKLVAKEADSDVEDLDYNQLGGAGKGYTRVQIDEDARSVTSMDDNTAYLFKEVSSNLLVDDEEAVDMLGQMQTTKTLLTEGQRIAYVGIVRLGIFEMLKGAAGLEKTKKSKKIVELSLESMRMWSQKIMLRLYSHMDIAQAEQVMIEQLSEHGVQPSDLTPSLMQNARVKNPMREDAANSTLSVNSPTSDRAKTPVSPPPTMSPTPASGEEKQEEDNVPEVINPEEYAKEKSLDIDLRWTVLCDLFLVLVSDSVYDSRSRQLLEVVGSYLEVPWLDICRFEKRVTDALEMQEAADKENWNEDEHMENRKKQRRNQRLMVMGLATVGGGLVIGLSAGLLAPLIGAGLAAGFTTIGVAGTGSFLAGAGGAAIITTTGIVTGSNIGFNASNRRTGAVKTFEYRPLHNNKRVNLIVTISGWLTGKVDDVRLPFSTVDPIMGDMYSVLWEPDMLRSMGDTINILATEALTQALQQILGSTILTALMAALQLPIVLTKLAYLIDNPWTVSLARADLAGLILADSLIDRNLGSRPITLVGYSIGSRVIYACLRELAKKGAFGIIQNVYIFGSPIVVNKEEFVKIRSIVPGRFVSGYATNDWILGYLFRATSGGIMRVAGLAPVDCLGDMIENYNVTEFVPGHMSYRQAMPRLLREVGWAVESDEFTEIEDPDPDNHEKRQRELINEIEEARKQLEAKPQSKSMFGFWKRKKQTEKKEWETYEDEKAREQRERELEGVESKEALETNASGVLFDIEALRKEVAELAAQGVEVKELPASTLPPIKIDLKSSPVVENAKEPEKMVESKPALEEKSNIKTITVAAAGATTTAFAATAISSSKPEVERTASLPTAGADDKNERPLLKPSATAPVLPPINLEHNAWADEFEEDFGKEKEISLTFE